LIETREPDLSNSWVIVGTGVADRSFHLGSSEWVVRTPVISILTRFLQALEGSFIVPIEIGQITTGILLARISTIDMR
jgi:hypothetical protein